MASGPITERARREFARLTKSDPGALPARGPERDGWLRGLRAKAYARRNGFPLLTIAELADHLGRQKIAA